MGYVVRIEGWLVGVLLFVSGCYLSHEPEAGEPPSCPTAGDTPTGCSTDHDCASRSSCATARCVEGRCLLTPRPLGVARRLEAFDAPTEDSRHRYRDATAACGELIVLAHRWERAGWQARLLRASDDGEGVDELLTVTRPSNLELPMRIATVGDDIAYVWRSRPPGRTATGDEIVTHVGFVHGGGPDYQLRRRSVDGIHWTGRWLVTTSSIFGESLNVGWLHPTSGFTTAMARPVYTGFEPPPGATSWQTPGEPCGHTPDGERVRWVYHSGFGDIHQLTVGREDDQLDRFEQPLGARRITASTASCRSDRRAMLWLEGSEADDEARALAVFAAVLDDEMRPVADPIRLDTGGESHQLDLIECAGAFIGVWGLESALGLAAWDRNGALVGEPRRIPSELAPDPELVCLDDGVAIVSRMGVRQLGCR